jgi:hypothetical protein
MRPATSNWAEIDLLTLRCGYFDPAQYHVEGAQ